jgi:hypothetical protein
MHKAGKKGKTSELSKTESELLKTKKAIQWVAF